MTEYKQFESSTYLQNIWYWHMSCEWQHEKHKNGGPFPFQGMVGIEEIAEALYGTEQKGGLTITGKQSVPVQRGVKEAFTLRFRAEENPAGSGEAGRAESFFADDF